MCVLGVEGSEKKKWPTPLRIISGTALRRPVSRLTAPSDLDVIWIVLDRTNQDTRTSGQSLRLKSVESSCLE